MPFMPASSLRYINSSNASVFITLSVIVIPAEDKVGVVKAVNVPAAGVIPPITTLSINPPPISTSSITTVSYTHLTLPTTPYV